MDEDVDREGGQEDYSDIVKKAPEWSVGIIIYNGTAYPLAKSKYRKSEYYFSTSWRPVAKNVGNDVVVLRDGKVSRYRISRRGEKYLQVVLV